MCTACSLSEPLSSGLQTWTALWSQDLGAAWAPVLCTSLGSCEAVVCGMSGAVAAAVMLIWLWQRGHPVACTAPLVDQSSLSLAGSGSVSSRLPVQYFLSPDSGVPLAAAAGPRLQGCLPNPHFGEEGVLGADIDRGCLGDSCKANGGPKTPDGQSCRASAIISRLGMHSRHPLPIAACTMCHGLTLAWLEGFQQLFISLLTLVAGLAATPAHDNHVPIVLDCSS